MTSLDYPGLKLPVELCCTRFEPIVLELQVIDYFWPFFSILITAGKVLKLICVFYNYCILGFTATFCCT